MEFAGFDWDHGNRTKCRKHDMSIEDVESLFHGILHVEPDPAHSGREKRFKAVGKTPAGRNALVVFTLRQQENGMRIRPISARFMHRKEVEHYEKEIARAKK